MRVALVTVGDTSRLTGGYLYHARVFASLRKEGVQVREFVASGASAAEQKEAASRFGALFDPHPFDVVVVDALARIVCAPHLDRWREARPVVAMVHELPSVAAPNTDAELACEGAILRADRVICVSRHGGAVLQDRGVPDERIRVVRPGSDRLAPPAGRPPATRDGVVRALCVAQWIERKGILDLVRAWTRRERPGAVLHLVGETDADPVYTRSVNAVLASVPGSSVAVRGPLDDAALARAYAAADLFVLPSRYEGYGIVYAEALSHGLPVVACSVGPVPELAGEGTALLVPPGDVGALSGALDLLLQDAALRGRMSAAARRRARQLPLWEDTAAGFLTVLREAVVERTRRGMV